MATLPEVIRESRNLTPAPKALVQSRHSIQTRLLLSLDLSSTSACLPDTFQSSGNSFTASSQRGLPDLCNRSPLVIVSHRTLFFLRAFLSIGLVELFVNQFIIRLPFQTVSSMESRNSD